MFPCHPPSHPKEVRKMIYKYVILSDEYPTSALRFLKHYPSSLNFGDMFALKDNAMSFWRKCRR